MNTIDIISMRGETLGRVDVTNEGWEMVDYVDYIEVDEHTKHVLTEYHDHSDEAFVAMQALVYVALASAN